MAGFRIYGQLDIGDHAKCGAKGFYDSTEERCVTCIGPLGCTDTASGSPASQCGEFYSQLGDVCPKSDTLFLSSQENYFGIIA